MLSCFLEPFGYHPVQKLSQAFRSQDMNLWIDSVQKHIPENATILDFGTGYGEAYNQLRIRGFEKTKALDITGGRFLYNRMDLTVYDGTTIPFRDNFFDVALAMTVLHHIPDFLGSLKELKRVSKNIIIVEDVPTSPEHAKEIYFWDSVVNLHFLDHPHNNQFHEQWLEIFSQLNLEIEEITAIGNWWGHHIYVLKA